MIRTKTDDTWTRLLRDDTWTRQGPANQSS
jgi:hypothetical protein